MIKRIQKYLTVIFVAQLFSIIKFVVKNFTFILKQFFTRQIILKKVSFVKFRVIDKFKKIYGIFILRQISKKEWNIGLRIEPN